MRRGEKFLFGGHLEQLLRGVSMYVLKFEGTRGKGQDGHSKLTPQPRTLRLASAKYETTVTY